MLSGTSPFLFMLRRLPAGVNDMFNEDSIAYINMGASVFRSAFPPSSAHALASVARSDSYAPSTSIG